MYLSIYIGIPCFEIDFNWSETDATTSDKDQAPVVQKVDRAIRWINLYPVGNAIGFPNTYPLDSDLSGG